MVDEVWEKMGRYDDFVSHAHGVKASCEPSDMDDRK